MIYVTLTDNFMEIYISHLTGVTGVTTSNIVVLLYLFLYLQMITAWYMQ